MKFGPCSEVRPATDLTNRSTDVLEIGWTGTLETVKSSRFHLELDPLRHPVEAIMKDCDDVVEMLC